MNFYETQMRNMFADNDILSDMKFTGKTMLARLDDEKLLKCQFVTTGVSNQYSAVMLSVINKDDGVVDKEIFRFSDIVGMYNRGNGLEPIEPHMWEYNGKPEWYTPLSKAQIKDIGRTVLEYAEMFVQQNHALEMQFT